MTSFRIFSTIWTQSFSCSAFLTLCGTTVRDSSDAKCEFRLEDLFKPQWCFCRAEHWCDVDKAPEVGSKYQVVFFFADLKMINKAENDTKCSSTKTLLLLLKWHKCCFWYLRTTRVRVLWELFTRQMASCREPLRGTAFTLTISSPGWSRTAAAALPAST